MTPVQSLEPAIAARKPKISNNGKTYTIVIRDGVKYDYKKIKRLE